LTTQADGWLAPPGREFREPPVQVTPLIVDERSPWMASNKACFEQAFPVAIQVNARAAAPVLTSVKQAPGHTIAQRIHAPSRTFAYIR